LCELYVRADPILYESRTRSLRIHGVVTTIRLEKPVLGCAEPDRRRGWMTTNQLITKLWDEILEWRRGAQHGSFLRVSCLRYLEAPGRVAPPGGAALGIGGAV
jgi:predicted DNA-binding ribbon-helix-helix protein